MLLNRIGYILLLIISSNTIWSQEIISSAGNFNENNSGTISWVLGEVIQSDIAVIGNNIQAENPQKSTTHAFVSTEFKIEYIVYPNPFNESIFITIQDDDLNTCSLNIFDIQGKLIAKHILTVGSNQIPTEKLKVGTYWMQIKSKKYSTEIVTIIKSN